MLDTSMTFKSISTSGTASSKASSLFDLDDHGRKSILVYRYRSGAKGLEVKTERALCEELDQDPSLPFIRVTKKPIPRGNSRLDIRSGDLMLPDERKIYGNQPTLNASVANVGLPTLAKWRHMILGTYDQLYIVSKSHSPAPSPDPSPAASKDSSPESSQHLGLSTPHPIQHPDA